MALSKPAGNANFTALLISIESLTIALDTEVEPNFSTPSSCLARLTSVSVTCLAFLDVHIVIAIMIPAVRSIRGFALTGAARELISKFEPTDAAGMPALTAAEAVEYESYPAMLTPIKLTRSFPAKARARAKVPASTAMFRILTLRHASKYISTVQKANSSPRVLHKCASTKLNKLSGITAVPLSPLNRAKYVIAVRANPHQSAPAVLTFLV